MTMVVEGAIDMRFLPVSFIVLILSISVASTAVHADTYTYAVTQDGDDGTEVNETLWFGGGYADGSDFLGTKGADRFMVGLRFHVDDLSAGQAVSFARMRLAAWGGTVVSRCRFEIRGVLDPGAVPFSQTHRPSQACPLTRARVEWGVGPHDWGMGTGKVPLLRSSPDLSPVINEIIALPGWGSGPEGKTAAFVLKCMPVPGVDDYVCFNDYAKGGPGMKSPAVLEVYSTVYDTLLGRELLGRVEDCSATLRLYSLLALDAFVEYGPAPGLYTHRTAHCLLHPAQEPLDLLLSGLEPDRRYYYRLRYRRAGDGAYEAGAEHTFHTQRSRGSTFVFAVQADEHLQGMYKLPANEKRKQLYKRTLANMGDVVPDLFLSMGDFANTEFFCGRDAFDYEEAKDRYLLERRYIDLVGCSACFYLVLGNHEGEQGWRYALHDDSWSNKAAAYMRAREAVIPNPFPDGFYAGNEDFFPEVSLREDYYAWEWGDALFVVLDPFPYTLIKPGQVKDGWAWTLGKQQYDWLYEVLHTSTTKWKFVFMHHMTTTVEFSYQCHYYGRGGIEVVKHKVAGQPTFEWGGEDEEGHLIFDQKRLGWTHGPVHDLLRNEGVNIVFHGHDHFFAKQDLDGIVYQECPRPSDDKYEYGFKKSGMYKYGDLLSNAGHLQVTVSPDSVKVEYVRAYLPGDGQNGEIAYSYILK